MSVGNNRGFDAANFRKLAAKAAIVLVALAGTGGMFVYSGIYNIAADVPHTRSVYWLLDNLRMRSIAVRARNIQPPATLDNPQTIASGAALYDEMCSGCHLAPGKEKTEISRGLYPAAPELSRGTDLTPAETFWIIKHGVKMTGMAAWGKTHGDPLIWDMVAFLRKLPTLSGEQYQSLVKTAPHDHDETMKLPEMAGEHSHAQKDQAAVH